MKQLTRQAGFTLVEAMVVMGLLAIFMTVLTSLFVRAIDVQSKSEAYASTVSDARFIMARLDYDIARASNVTTPASLGSSSASLVMTISGTTYTYALSSGNLQLTDAGGADRLNSSGTTVSALTFQRLGNSGGKESIRYSFTVTSTAHHVSGNDVRTYTSTTERRL